MPSVSCQQSTRPLNGASTLWPFSSSSVHQRQLLPSPRHFAFVDDVRTRQRDDLPTGAASHAPGRPTYYVFHSTRVACPPACIRRVRPHWSWPSQWQAGSGQLLTLLLSVQCIPHEWNKIYVTKLGEVALFHLHLCPCNETHPVLRREVRRY